MPFFIKNENVVQEQAQESKSLKITTLKTFLMSQFHILWRHRLPWLHNK